jgi:ATP synthase protein I
MLAYDARILIRSAVATAIAGGILIAIGAVGDGGKGALGAALGMTLVAVFFTLSVVAVSLAGRWGPAAMTGTALGTYVVKILAVAVIVVSFRDTTAFNTKLFGLTAIICILVWSAGQLGTLARRRVPYVVPDNVVPDMTAADVAAETAQGVESAPQARDAGPAPGTQESSRRRYP